MTTTAADQAESQLRSIIHHLYALTIQAFDYPTTSTSTAMRHELTSLIQSLSGLQRAAAHLDITVPDDIINYVERGRNPDIYTREFVEAAQNLNQEMKGRSEAYTLFRDVLAKEITTSMPELKGEVESVMQETSTEAGTGTAIG